jgi:hypothetical protein
MDQRPVVLCTVLKQLLVRAIHEDLAATLEANAVVYSSVTRYLREMRHSAPTDTAPSVVIPMVMDDADQGILAALDEIPFASIRCLS